PSFINDPPRRSNHCAGRRPDQGNRHARRTHTSPRPLFTFPVSAELRIKRMIYSMTGFGSARVEATNLTVLVEVKSVNHRYIDIHVKIPGEYQAFENVIRQKLSTRFKRGRLDVFVRIDYKRENVRLDVNHMLLRAYSELMTELKKTYPIQGEL